jgi:hypothetical protein
MSNIFIANIVGNGTYAVPESDAELTAATAGLDTLVSGVVNFVYSRVLAWVETIDGVGANRCLNCLIEQFTYGGDECPSTAETVLMTAAIETELENDPGITAIGNQHVHIFAAGAYFLWSRNSVGGYLYPTTVTDDIAVGAGPNGRWFNDGDLVLGAAAMSGTERLRVVGNALIEGKLTVTGLVDPTGIVLDEQSSVPGGNPGTAKGTFWIKDNVPNSPYFTDDANNDRELLTAASALWTDSGAYLRPTTTSRSIAVGSGPNGRWFNDGDLVLGANAMSGAERLRIVSGGARIEKVDSSAVNALYIQAATNHPVAQQAALLDIDVNSIALDIDSEATSKPLINLQPVVGNTRGDIAFGTARTSNPASPNEGDVWYNSTDHCYYYYNGTIAICIASGSFGDFYAYNSSDVLSTTTSIIYQQKVRLSVTGIPAGNYRVGYCFTRYRTGNAAKDFEARVQVDDATTIWYTRVCPGATSSSIRCASGGFVRVTLTEGNHDIDLDYRIAPGGGGGPATAGIDLARLELWEVE